MANQSFGPDELKAAAGHVQYEFDMLKAAAQRLAELSHEQNNYLEVLLIHFRALAFHLGGVGNKEDDIHASDFGAGA